MSASGGGSNVLRTAMDPNSTSVTTRPTTRPPRKSTSAWTSGSSGTVTPAPAQAGARVLDHRVEGEAVGGLDHGYLPVPSAEELVRGEGEAVGEHLLRRRQPADRHDLDLVRVLLGELPVDHRVVLAVVADEDPPQVRELAGQTLQLVALVLTAAAEPAGVGRAPVGEQERTGGVVVPLQE